MNRLKDKRVIITGAAGGIGAATARLFIEEGARVFLVDRATAVSDVAASLVVPYAVADVSDEDATRGFVASAVERLGGLDVYVANAGTEGHVHPLVEVTQADFDRVLAVNVRSVWLAIKHAVPYLLATRGNIVATASVAGLIGSPGLGPYIASKHAVLGLVKTAAAEYDPKGVRVNAVCPGPIENRMMRSIEEQAAPGAAAAVHEGFVQMVPLGRYGTNGEIAAAIAFLASPEASYCTGAALVADGGFVAG